MEECRPVENASQPATAAQKPGLNQAILDSKPRAKKNIQCNKYPRVIRVLETFVEVIIITKQILDLEVNLIIGELLALTFVVEKRLTKTISKDKAI